MKREEYKAFEKRESFWITFISVISLVAFIAAAVSYHYIYG